MDNLHVHSKTSTTRNRNCLLPELGDFVTMTISQDQDQQQTTQRQQPE